MPRSIWRNTALLHETPIRRKSSRTSLKPDTARKLCRMSGTGWARLSWQRKNEFEAGPTGTTVQERVSERVAKQIVDVPAVVQHQVPMSPEAEKSQDKHGGRGEDRRQSRLENCCVPVRHTFTEAKLMCKFEAGHTEIDVSDALDQVNKNRLEEKAPRQSPIDVGRRIEAHDDQG